MMSGRWPLIVAFLSLVLMSACGDSTAKIEPQENEELPTADAVEVAPGDVADRDNSAVSCCMLLPSGLTDYEINVGSHFPLGVLLFSLQTGDPIANATISWSVTGDGDASLSSFTSMTDESGYAEIELRGGSVLTTYTVIASYSETDPVEFTLTVEALPTGTLAVNVIDSGAAQLRSGPFDVKLYYTEEVDCRHINPLSLPPAELASVTAENDGDLVSFDGLLTGYEYTVAGVGYGPEGGVVSKACIDGMQVFEDTTSEIDLIFQLIPLNPVGTYLVRSYFDFGDAIAGTGAVGEWLIKIFDGFDNPGELLYDVIMNEGCGAFLPGLLCDGAGLVADLLGIDEEIQNFINDLVMSSETGCSIIRAGCDVRGAIRTLEVLSAVYMSKLGADYRIYGATNFTGLAFYWRYSCPVGAPDDCGRFELSYDEVLDLQLVSGDWQGVVTGYDQLVIESHAVDLNYGKLIVYLINQVILPEIAGGATSFTEALEYWFNCDGFANWLSGIEIAGASLDWDTSYSVCSGAINFLGGVVGFGTGLLSLQEYSSAMTLNGEVTFVENTGDFFVDELVDGTWSGVLRFGEGTSPIRGWWSGCQVGEDGTCEYPDVTQTSLGGQNTCRCDASCNCE